MLPTEQTWHNTRAGSSGLATLETADNLPAVAGISPWEGQGESGVPMPWFRLYTDFASDAKVQLLAFEDQRHFVVILCLKGNGTLDGEAKNPEHRERIIAKSLGLSVSAAAEARRRLDEAGLIAPDWQPLAWEKRQAQSDSSAARTRRWRANKKGVTPSERHGDVTVTEKIRSEENRKDQNRGESREESAGSRVSPTDPLPAPRPRGLSELLK